jgi:hypothetical protein
MNKQGFLGVNLTVLVWVLLFLAPLALDEWTVSQFGQYLTYGILAMSLAFIWGQVGILCFGQAIFFGLGAYLMALTTLEKFTWFGGSQIMGLLLATVGPAIAAYILGKMLFVGRGLSGAFFAIVTLCAAVVVEIVAQRIEFIGGFVGCAAFVCGLARWRHDDDERDVLCSAHFRIADLPGGFVFPAITVRGCAGGYPQQRNKNDFVWLQNNRLQSAGFYVLGCDGGLRRGLVHCAVWFCVASCYWDGVVY